MTHPTADDADEQQKDWRDKALCAQIGGDLWFPEKGDRGGPRRARETCARCPVAEQCLELAVNNPAIQHGIWGGKTPTEIRLIRNARGIAGDVVPEDEEPEDEDVYAA